MNHRREALAQMTLENEKVDIHYVFPINYCEKREKPIPYWLYQSVVNKAPIDARTNRSIGGRAPSSYLPNLEERVSAWGRFWTATVSTFGRCKETSSHSSSWREARRCSGGSRMRWGKERTRTSSR